MQSCLPGFEGQRMDTNLGEECAPTTRGEKWKAGLRTAWRARASDVRINRLNHSDGHA